VFTSANKVLFVTKQFALLTYLQKRVYVRILSKIFDASVLDYAINISLIPVLTTNKCFR